MNGFKRQLFLFHFAGGSRYSFEFLTPFLADFEIIALELPGRGDRVKENLTKDFEKAAADLLSQVLGFRKDPNFIFYGHSLGALLAFRVCQLLEDRNIPPAYIVVSGNPGPGIDPDKNMHELGDEDFIAELKSLGGIPEEIFEDSNTLSFFLPILRSDFELANKIKLELKSRINTPIYAVMGDKEEHVGEITNWKNFTTVDFQFRIFEGSHFFIYEQPKRVADFINYFTRDNT